VACLRESRSCISDEPRHLHGHAIAPMTNPTFDPPATAPQRRTTVSGRPIDELYTADDLPDAAPPEPGRFPYTRGIHASGYGGKLWTMRQFSGFGTPAETNQRYKELLAAGGTGLSVAFDLPTLMGRDPDHPLSLGEVGKCGVSVASLADMERLFEGIRLDEVTTSMTINSPAAMILAMYLVVAERQGVAWSTVAGTLQNDILKEYIAQKEYIYPPRPSMRLVTDTFGFCAREVPRWNTISVSGYHIREAGATALQELAFTLRDGIEYVQYGIDAGLDVDAFVPRISFFFNAHNDFFEEIAKYRAARTLWATIMRDRFGATDERSLKLRFHAQTAGVSLTAQQPHNNVTRTAIQALAAVLGGANSLHTNSLDEALSLPTRDAALLALRTQQVLALESGVADYVDPLGGSYFIESLTRDMEAGAQSYFERIDERGGMVAAIEEGFPQREIAESAYRFQREVESGERTVVGVNGFADESRSRIETLYLGEDTADEQCAALARLRQTRDATAVDHTLDALREAALGPDNLMPFLLDAVRAYATVGEMCDALRDAWGEYEEVVVI
jgi:methylmalonyl-CoA mutase N-terminal domain/subunit